MKNKPTTLLIFSLILSSAAISSLDGLYLFKQIYFGFAMIGLISLGFFSLYNRRKL